MWSTFPPGSSFQRTCLNQGHRIGSRSVRDITAAAPSGKVAEDGPCRQHVEIRISGVVICGNSPRPAPAPPPFPPAAGRSRYRSPPFAPAPARNRAPDVRRQTRLRRSPGRLRPAERPAAGRPGEHREPPPGGPHLPPDRGLQRRRPHQIEGRVRPPVGPRQRRPRRLLGGASLRPADLGHRLHQGEARRHAGHGVVRRRQAERQRAVPRPAPDRPPQEQGGDHLGGRAGRRENADLSATAPRGLQVRRRVAEPRRGEGRPRDLVYADDPRTGDRHAGLRPDRGGAFDYLRGLFPRTPSPTATTTPGPN